MVKVIKLCQIVNWEGNDWSWKVYVKHSLAVREWKRRSALKITRADQQRMKPWNHLIKSIREVNYGSWSKTGKRKGQRHDLTSSRERKSYWAKGSRGKRCKMKRSQGFIRIL